jgi:8-oxo-dGTP pyrophosphatase MutT (NUDIX family)
VTDRQTVPPLSKLPNFDPRTVPVESVDSHLPMVPAQALRPQQLKQRFRTPPIWQPELVQEPRFVEREPVHAAVLLAIIMREQPTVLLTERTTQLVHHSGQIAFPGGKADEGDADAAATALREASEEVGLDPAMVEVLGVLPHYLTGSAFIISPVVALVRPGFTLSLNHEEVAQAFEVPLHFLMNPANHRRHSLQWQGLRREWLSMPYQDGSQERFIWGATAGMLRNFYRFLIA